MGIAFDVGFGRIDIKIVEEMLQNPKFPDLKNPLMFRMADPRGLYLADVIYSDEDLKDSTDDHTKLPIGNPTEYPSRLIEWLVENCYFLHPPFRLGNFNDKNSQWAI